MRSQFLRQSLLAASVVTIGVGLLGRFFGYAREAIIAGYFGTHLTFDTFIIASTIPELATLILFAALPTAIVPWLSSLSKSDSSVEALLFWRGLAAFGALFAMLSVSIYTFRTPILIWLAPNLDAEQMSLGGRLIGMLAWFVFFRGLEAYFRGWLYAKKHFVIPALSPFILNAVIIIAVTALYGRLTIEALAIGWLAASVVLFCINGIFLAGFLGLGDTDNLISPRIMPVLRLTFAVAAVETISLAYPAVDRFLAARYLGEGQIAALRYSLYLTQLPPGVMVATFSLASFPWITDLSVSANIEPLRRLYRESLGLIVFVILPVAVGMVMFSEDIIRVAFQRGAFDEQSLRLTAGPFVYYCLGLLFYSVYIYQMRYYYARRLVLRLGSILSIMLMIKIIGSLILIGPMSHSGLAAATSLAWLTGLLVMTADLERSLHLSVAKEISCSLARIVPLTAVLIVYWVTTESVWSSSSANSTMAALSRLVVLGGSGAGLYFGLAYLFRLPEAGRVVQSVKSRLRTDWAKR